jgi:multiple sugar transport system substrate-binding protein
LKEFKKSFVKLLVLILSLGTLLTACSGNEEETAGDSTETEDEKVVLDFWTFWGSETRRPVIEKIINDFNESQDEIEVKHTYLPWGDIWTKSLASIAAGDPPDVIINDINKVRQRALKEQNTNLAEYLGDDVKDQYFPRLWDATLYKGDPYAVPFNTDTRLLFWNKDKFEEAGLDPEQPPTTWKEVKEFGLKLDKKNGDRYQTIGFLPRYGLGPDIWMINATGDGYWNYEEGKPEINEPKAVEALQWIKDYEDVYGSDLINGFKADFGNQQSNPFITGKVAMAISTPTSLYTQIRDYGDDINFGIAPMPEFEPGNGNTTWGGGFVAEVPYGAKNPEASVEFIKYLTGPKAQEYWAVKNFDNVANIEGANNAAKSSELDKAGQRVYQMAVDNMEDTILTPIPVEAPDMSSLINPEIDKFFLGDKSAEEALKDAQKAVEKLAENTK